jgi:hypothetical protein
MVLRWPLVVCHDESGNQGAVVMRSPSLYVRLVYWMPGMQRGGERG